MQKFFIELQVCSGKWADVQRSSWESVTGPGSGLGLQSSECWNLGCKWNSRKGCSQWSSFKPSCFKSKWNVDDCIYATYFCKSAIKFFLQIANETPLSKACLSIKAWAMRGEKTAGSLQSRNISESGREKRRKTHRNCDDVSVLTIDIQHLRQPTLLSCPFMLQLGFTAVAMPIASKSDLRRESKAFVLIYKKWNMFGYNRILHLPWLFFQPFLLSIHHSHF